MRERRLEEMEYIYKAKEKKLNEISVYDKLNQSSSSWSSFGAKNLLYSSLILSSSFLFYYIFHFAPFGIDINFYLFLYLHNYDLYTHTHSRWS
jgi:hypothetical protein